VATGVLATWLQRCPGYRGVLATEGVLDTEVSWIQRCPGYRGVLDTGVLTSGDDLEYKTHIQSSKPRPAPPPCTACSAKVLETELVQRVKIKPTLLKVGWNLV
jgi:hypothetical protein